MSDHKQSSIESTLFTRSGQLSKAPPETTRLQIRSMVSESQTATAGIALFIHGGLVPLRKALENAETLSVKFETAGAYLIFLAWETGFFESFRNAIGGRTTPIFGRSQRPSRARSFHFASGCGLTVESASQCRTLTPVRAQTT